MRTAGLVLAAGEGRRMGCPKALLRDPAGLPWVVRVVRVLTAAGLGEVVVVTGAAGHEVREALRHENARMVHAADWRQGMGASLRAGLAHVADDPGVDAVLVCLVDTPGLTPQVVRRLAASAGPDALARATYEGAPGHPVLIGARHFAGVAGTAAGDTGARAYLAEHRAVAVECADLAAGADVDTVSDLPPGHRLG